ncbi:MAG: GH3 family domain-containing protein [Gemmataceae bacterium]
MNGGTVQGWLTVNVLVRRAAEALLISAGRRHLAQFDRCAPAPCQRRILLGLLHQAQATRFGRDHDFRRIRSVADYRRLVPLWTRAELWRDYWEPVYPHLAGATWPDEGYSSLTPRLLSSCHRSALRTALALAVHVRPRLRLLTGTLLFVSDEGPSRHTDPLSVAERLPALIRPYTQSSAEPQAEHWADLPVTGLIGPAERLLHLLEQIKQARGKRHVRDVWPTLSAILYTRHPSAAPAGRLRGEVGEDVVLLEMAGRVEGPLAVEDPRFGSLRLLFDHGIYFEFVPPDALNEPRCPRFDIEDIELGVPYELAVTSPAGLWACRIGRTVCLQRRDPPLLRFVEPTAPKPIETRICRPSRRTDLVLSTPLPAPHPQSDGIPAALPENSCHSP